MSTLVEWLTKPRATVRVEARAPWAAWMKALRGSFGQRSARRQARMEVLARLALGGKKSLLLISVDGSRMMVGVGEDGAPTLVKLGRSPMSITPVRSRSRSLRVGRRKQW
jgi:flagellar biogenesis protein FliO